MAPYNEFLAQRAVEATESHLYKRDLTVNHTQAVTLGVMGAYVVVIAILWNVPVLRYSLWPFKVRYTNLPLLPLPPNVNKQTPLTPLPSLSTDARDRLSRIRPRNNSLLHRRAREIHLSRPPRGRRHPHAGWHDRNHTAGGVPGVVDYRGTADLRRVQYHRE